jgi:hypothetical protein
MAAIETMMLTLLQTTHDDVAITHTNHYRGLQQGQCLTVIMFAMLPTMPYNIYHINSFNSLANI